MKFRQLISFVLCALILGGMLSVAYAQQRQQQQQQSESQASDASPYQRVDIMRSRLDAMRRSLNSGIATLNAQDNGQQQQNRGQHNASSDDPRQRLRGLLKEVESVSSEVNDIGNKVEHSERFERSKLDQ